MLPLIDTSCYSLNFQFEILGHNCSLRLKIHYVKLSSFTYGIEFVLVTQIKEEVHLSLTK